MIRLIALLLALCAFSRPALADERRYAVSDFDRVIVEGPFTVTLVTGRSTGASATGPAQALERVTIDVQGQTLRVRPNRAAWGGNPDRPPTPATIALATRDLRSARIVGTGSLEIRGLRGLRVDLVAEGGAQLAARNVAADALNVTSTGSASLTLAGTAGTFRADLIGSGSLDAPGFTAENATIVSRTSGTVRLDARRTANVSAFGLGAIAVGGNPACTVTGPRAAEVGCGSDQSER